MCLISVRTIRVVTFTLIAIVCFVSVSAAQVTTNKSPSVDVVVLSTSTGLQNVATLSAAFLTDQLNVQTISKAVDLPVGGGRKALEGLVRNYQANVSLAVIVLADTRQQPGGTNSYISIGQKCGIIDFGVLKTVLGSETLPARMVEIHATRACMRVIGATLGMKVCPNPFCVMNDVAVKKRATLGRNFCPPCAKVVRERLIAQGLFKDTKEPRKPKSK